jgi:hypothetical protein
MGCLGFTGLQFVPQFRKALAEQEPLLAEASEAPGEE